MTTRLAIATAVALTLAACSSSPSTMAPARSDTSAPTETPAATDGVTETPLTPSDPGVCQADRLTLQVAAEAYQAETGRPPTDQQQLVDGGLLRETIPGYELKVTGEQVDVVAVPGVCG